MKKRHVVIFSIAYIAMFSSLCFMAYGYKEQQEKLERVTYFAAKCLAEKEERF